MDHSAPIRYIYIYLYLHSITLELDRYNTTSLSSLTGQTASDGHQKATFTLTFSEFYFQL